MEALSENELRRHILIFLQDFKELVGQGRYYVRDHLKNIIALKNLSLTSRMRDEIIFSISLEDYSSGPNPDELHPGNYWGFGKRLETI